MELTDWQRVEAALLLIRLTKISLTKSSFNLPSVIVSPLRLWALIGSVAMGISTLLDSEAGVLVRKLRQLTPLS
jgi:hypothetical protein